nr:MAG TPA: hypothetical protein [Caudoviricetes sp.]
MKKRSVENYFIIGGTFAFFGALMIIAGFVIEKITPILIPFIVVWSIGLILLFQGISALKMNKLIEAREETEKKFAEKQAELDAEREQDRKKYIDSVFTLESKLNEMQKKYTESGFEDYETAQKKLAGISTEIADAVESRAKIQGEIDNLYAEAAKADKRAKTASNKAAKLIELCNAFASMLKKRDEIPDKYFTIPNFTAEEITSLCPSVEMKIHSMDVRDLQKEFRANDKRIDEVTEAYRGRYTTKSNQAIYSLMVIALRAELQNILYDLKYQKLDQGIDNVKVMTAKYLQIACEGNQSIAPTMLKFIGEIEYLFITSVKIEYDYYVRKEQARQEQLAIREQMRQEAEERKALEAERKKVEQEEQKFKNQINDVNTKLSTAEGSEADELRKRLLELEAQLSNVTVKKENIVNLQNGKAGNVYIISNLGSFGENVFKIGMTRRLDPQERVDELGSASVPFGFDVHSFIFSDDAVGLENELHKRLNEKRVNKVNMRKEFFSVSLDELEALTREISPTSEFRRTMAAEEYRQSISGGANYEDVTESDDDEEEDDSTVA